MSKNSKQNKGNKMTTNTPPQNNETQTPVTDTQDTGTDVTQGTQTPEGEQPTDQNQDNVGSDVENTGVGSGTEGDTKEGDDQDIITPTNTEESNTQTTDLETADTVTPTVVTGTVTDTIEETAVTTSNAVVFDYTLVPISDELKADIQNLANEDEFALRVLNGIITYVQEMRPGRQQSEVDGGTHQANLFRTIRLLFNTNSNNFTQIYSLVLRIVKELRTEEKNVFGDRYLYRFFNSIQLNESDTNLARKWFNLITATADAKGRKEAVAQVDINKLVERGLTEEARNRLLNFYNN